MNYALLIDALAAVETGGHPHPERAVGDNGRSIGVLQIQQGVIQDVNRVNGSRFTWADAYDPAKARLICQAYLRHYCVPSRIGTMNPYEAAARIWNGGPQGHIKNATIAYWLRVQKHLGPSPHTTP